MTVNVAPSRPYRGPDKQHATEKERWLDVSFQVDRQIAEIERRDYVGDSFPCFFANVGPGITASLFGAKIDYLNDRTGWSEPVGNSPQQWQQIIESIADFDNDYWQAMWCMTAMAIEACNDRYVVVLQADRRRGLRLVHMVSDLS